MRASKLRTVISRLRNDLEWSAKAQIESLDVNFYISNEVCCIFDVELRYEVSRRGTVHKFVKNNCE